MMDDSNDFDFAASNQNETSIQHGSQSEDEEPSLNEHNVDLADEESIYNEIHDDDEDFGSSSEIELPPSPRDHLEGKSDLDENLINSNNKSNNCEYKNELIIKEEEKSPTDRIKRTSGRLRKDGKVPMHAKNLFPGRPGRNNRPKRKFAQNLILNFSDHSISIKSPSIPNHEIDMIDSKSVSTITSEVNEQTTTEHVLMDNNIDQKPSTYDLVQPIEPNMPISPPIHQQKIQIIHNPEKIPTAKKKLNHPGKIKGKLSGSRRNKTMEYRKKRGPKGKFKNFSAVSTSFSSPGTSNGGSTSNLTNVVSQMAIDNDKQDDTGNENKIILCSSKDSFILSQDVCVMCGSLGKDEEGRLLSCAQCGQCYHPFCAGISKVTKIMLEKGWRCLECTVCEGCGKATDDSRLLLCDDCDISYHTYCLDPPLEEVPQGTWKCQWCVVCIKCRTTSPGYRSQWQENYTMCGPCASQEKCSVCKTKYDENDLIIQCIQCHRWLHSKCDSMYDENECEIASSIGYYCLNCRPLNDPPPHIQARKNGTLRSIFNKKRAEERNDPVLMKKNEAQQKDSNLDGSFDSSTNENAMNSSAKLLSKYHLVDGVYLSEAGLAMIKSQAVEQPKKTRVKRKNINKDEQQREDEQQQQSSNNKDFEENIDENEDEKKKRLRRLRLDKLGIGGFLIKQRGRFSCNKDDDEMSQDNCETRSITPDNPDKPKRRRRINKKKNQLQDQYPSYLQEAFFGKNLMDVIASSNGGVSNNSDLHLSEKETEDEDDEQKLIGRDKIVNLNSLELAQNINKNINKNDELNFLDDNFQAENFDDFSVLSPDDAFVDMFNDETLDRNEDEVLNELTANENTGDDKNDDSESKIVMEDMLDSSFNFNELNDAAGLPQMDSKDVEDLFEVMSNSSLPAVQPVVAEPQQIPPKEYQENNNPTVMMPQNVKPNVESIDLPLVNHPQKSDLSGSSTPTAISESLSNLHQQFSTFEHSTNQAMTNNNPYKIASKPNCHQQQDSSNQSSYYLPPSTTVVTAEQDSETVSQGQKNFIKWESEEALGQCATISAVLYSNMNHPNLKTEYPIWADRIKQIHKIWRQLSTDQRQPYLQMARDNRSNNKKNQAEMMNKMNSKNKIESSDKQWKQEVSNNPSGLNSSNINVPPSMSSQSNSSELGYSLNPSEYSTHPNKLYSSSPSPMGIHPGQSMAQLSPNQMIMPNIQQQQATQSPHTHHPPMSPAAMMHSPRLRPYSENYPQQQQPPPQSGINQPHMMRQPSTTHMVSQPQASFSPNSPSLNVSIHSSMSSSSECQYQSMSPSSTPQRPQSTASGDLQQQHSYGQPPTPTPYGPSGPRTPFSPSHQPHHQSGGMHTNNNDPYGSMPPSVSQQSNMDANMDDIYKVSTAQQPHQMSKPPSESSYIHSSMPGSSLPSTTQPPLSPQVPVPSTISNADIYARSPRPPVTTSQPVVRGQSFDETNYGSQRQTPELYSPNTNVAYSSQYIQQQNTVSYNMSDGYSSNPVPSQEIKVQMRPNMPISSQVPIRPNIPVMRRTLSDPYNNASRQPIAVSNASGPGQNFSTKMIDEHDSHSNKQHLRNLLQVQQMRRQESIPSTSSSTPPVVANQQQRPPMWSQPEPNNSFRQPMSPVLNRNRLPMQQPVGSNQSTTYPATMEQQNFRFAQNDQQRSMMIHRNPNDIRFRPQQSSPQQQQQQLALRFSPHQQQSLNQQQIQQIKQQQGSGPRQSKLGPQQQQWSSSTDSSPSMSPHHHPNNQINMSTTSHNQFSQSCQPQNISNVRQPSILESEIVKVGNNDPNEIKIPPPQITNEVTDDVEESSLPVELGDDDELLQLGNDFNILEYADPELDSKTGISGHSGKSNIFDELDEKDMLASENKDKENESNKNEVKPSGCGQEVKNEIVSSEKPIISNNESQHQPFQQQQQQVQYSNNNNSSQETNRIYGQQNTKTDIDQIGSTNSTIKHEQPYFQNISSNPFLSDDDFERLKNDFLNDSDQVNPGYSQQQVAPPPSVHHTNAGPSMISSQQNPVMSQNQQSPTQHQPHQQQQVYQQQYNPTTINSGQQQPAGPVWSNRMSYAQQQQQQQNRMHLRIPMNQGPPSGMMSRPHIQQPPPGIYASQQPGNRIMLQQPNVHQIQMQPNAGIMRQPSASTMANVPPPSSTESESYDLMQQQSAAAMVQKQKHFENEIGKLRKMKKSLNAKQRQCRKNQNELNEHDASELARVTQEIILLQKKLDQIRKINRQNNVLQEKRKQSSNVNLPHSPSTQTSPRSVNSPLAVLNTSGPGTPLGICPSTPQSPSLTSPSPSSLMQNSPISSLHSPASIVMPPSPMPNNSEIASGVAIRPQIVQEDNNPFSDVYLQKEKKQTIQQQQSNMYQQIPKEMNPIGVDSRQPIYQSNFDDNSSMQQSAPPSQYYHGQPNTNVPYSMRPQSSMNFSPQTQSYQRFQGSGVNPHFASQQQPQMNYQQMRRPPPPPYPGNPQQHGYGPRTTSGYPTPNQQQQIRMQSQMRNSLEQCQMNPSPQLPPQSHSVYSDASSPMMQPNELSSSYQQINPMEAPMPIVGEAETTMEFNISEPGNGVDNESDPFTFLKDTTTNENRSLSTDRLQQHQQQQQAGSNVSNSNIDTVSQSSLSQSGMGNQGTTNNDSQNDNTNCSLNHQSPNTNSNEFSSSSVSNEKFALSNDDQPDCSLVSNDESLRINNYNQSDDNKQSDNSEDSSRLTENASTSAAIKQNALLKQLLQNCPSADHLKSLTQEDQSMMNINNESVQNNEVTETTTKSFVDDKQLSNETITNTATIDQVTNAIPINETPNVTPVSSNNFTTTPTVEKKLSYLDIRRAQLERDPTPPLEDIKPKRKRTIKRKESQKSNDGDSTDQNANNSTNTTTKTKKRQRKGSQTKNEDANVDSICNNEKILTSIMNHLRSLPAVNIVEPEVKLNLNVCLPPDASDFNSRKPQLKGCYGNAFLPSHIDYYSYYPFGPNKPASIIASNSNSSNPNSKVGYYNEEFGRSILDLKDYLMKESRDIKSESLSLYSRDVDSPETVVSASSPECVLYDYPKDEYNRMKYINDQIDSDEDENRKSPFLTFLPIHPIPIYSSLKGSNKENKENYDENQKSKLLKISNSSQQTPLKESGNNVGITIMINSEHDVKNVMKALAKLLNLKSSFSYSIEKSPNSRITEVLEIFDNNHEDVYCKFCNCLVKDQGFKAADDHSINGIDLILDEDYFCNKECFKNYALTHVNIVASKDDRMIDNKDEDDDLTSEELQQNDITENELVSIFNHGSDHGTEDLDSIISIHEKHWKNTRYLYWNSNSFKNENQIQTVEEPVEELLDRMKMCLKPNRNSQEKRQCIFCHSLGDGIANGPSRLLNMDVDKWVHLNCALWSNEVYEMLNGALMNVDQAYKRAMNSSCVSCSKLGASIKCFKFRCNNSYHFPCAIREKCVFYTDKTLLCPVHSSKGPLQNAEEMSSFAVGRRVYINRDEQKQIAAMLHQGDDNLMRIGSLIFLNIGQLLPHQLQNFHTKSYIYPIGYKVSRFYWSSRKAGKRCQYICSIDELDGKPQFFIEIREEGYENVVFQASTPKLALEKIIESIVKLREDSQTIKVFFDFISGEDLFGLSEPAIVRILESLPGVETLDDYNSRYGRSPWYELPLAINPSGCARCEPKKRFHFKRPHTLHVSSNTVHRSSLQSPLTNSESSSPYVKQFVHSKVSQYRKMKQEWRNNVYLGRSRIQGLGLYANKDIEKHTMIIEYIGLVIRNSIADRNERIHEAHNRGIYMFRLDDNRIIDATLEGGLARYVNHSCDPNCVAECVQIDRENKILIIANRRIQKGEELTYDYKFDVEDDQHKIPCLCGAANCRKWMN